MTAKAVSIAHHAKDIKDNSIYTLFARKDSSPPQALKRTKKPLDKKCNK